MTNEEQIESKVERSIFKQLCPKCQKYIQGTSKKQLDHTFRLHTIYCQSKKKEPNDFKKEVETTENGAI